MNEPLPEDLIIDFLAIEIALRGIRPVKLTRIEQEIVDRLKKILADDQDVALL
jgi:hypothetical protein